MNEVQRIAVKHREDTGHQMAVIDGNRASCAECDFAVGKHGPLAVIVTTNDDALDLDYSSVELQLLASAQVRMTAACIDGDHDRCKCLLPGQDRRYAGLIVRMGPHGFEPDGPCGCPCHADSPVVP